MSARRVPAPRPTVGGLSPGVWYEWSSSEPEYAIAPPSQGSADTDSETREARSARLWRRVRQWIHRSFGKKAPRPMPILLEDLYPPPARTVYQTIRSWQQSAESVLADVPLPMANTLAETVGETARVMRRHIFLVQRLRHLIDESALEAEAHPLYPLWRRHRVGWNGGLAAAMEALVQASKPLSAKAPRELEPDDLTLLDETCDRIIDQAQLRNDHIEDALETGADS